MPKTTKKYGLIQPEEYENYDIQVQNQNMSRIEEELSKRKEYDPEEMSAEDAVKASVKYTDEKIKELIGTAPEALDTIYELAAAIKDNEDLLEIIKKAVEESAKKEELTAHEKDGTVHVTEQERKSWNDSNSKKHEHDNKSILDIITESLITAWNDAVEHITDGTRHVTSKNKELWNTVSDKADADSVPTKVSQLENDSNYLKSVPDEYVTDTEMKQYAQPKGDYLTGESDPTVPAWAKEDTKPSYSKEEVGLGKVDNTADADKRVKYAESAGSADNATKVNNHTVDADVPAGAKFTDTKYDLNTMINGLSVDDLTPADDDYYVSQYAGGGTTKTTYHRRSMKALWSYIKSKVEGLGYTKNTGTLTGIKMNGKSQGTSGVVDLGTVLTSGEQTTVSADDGGTNVYMFSDGSTIIVKNGSKGSKGDTGSAGTNGAAGTRGSVISCGTAITGTSTTATVFTGSGLASSLVNDLYINTSTFNVYKCTVAGNASTAKWVYVGCIKGAKGNNGTNATTTAVASTSANGLMSKEDKVKLNNVETKMKTAVFFVKK